MEHSLEATKVYKDFIESPSGIVLDGFMNAVPGYNGAWIAMKNSIEQGKDMKILRGLELLELFGDEKFQSEFLQSNQAVDGFGLCFEAIVKQRNESKRKIIKRVLLGFIDLTEEQKIEFELEKFLEITKNISIHEIDYLRHLYFDIKPLQDKFIQHENSINHHDTSSLIRQRPLTSFIQDVENLYRFKDAYENLDYNDYKAYQNGLVGLNILFPFYKNKLTFDMTSINPEYDFTAIGKNFILYISENEKA